MQYKQIGQDGNFELYSIGVEYKEIFCTDDMSIINKETIENMGTSVKLYKHYYGEDGILLDEPESDNDCYEVIINE